MNVSRNIRRKNEELYWSFIPRQFNLYRLSIAGNLANLTLPVRRIRTVTPYVLTSSQERWTSGVKQDSKRPTEFGGEIKYGVTPALTLDLTVNTDFAQVEVDDQRVNLTRFPIFFPEKRPFFLENAGVFSAGTPQAVDLFFTRRIGIDANGQPVPILGGGRLTTPAFAAMTAALEAEGIASTALALPPGDSRREAIRTQLLDSGYGRFHTYQEWSLPMLLGGFLSVTPEAGIGYTRYGAVEGPESGSDNTHMHIGVESSLKFTRDFGAYQNHDWGLDGLLHVIQPYSTWSVVSTDDFEPGDPGVDRLTPTTRPRPIDPDALRGTKT